MQEELDPNVSNVYYSFNYNNKVFYSKYKLSFIHLKIKKTILLIQHLLDPRVMELTQIFIILQTIITEVIQVITQWY